MEEKVEEKWNRIMTRGKGGGIGSGRGERGVGAGGKGGVEGGSEGRRSGIELWTRGKGEANEGKEERRIKPEVVEMQAVRRTT